MLFGSPCRPIREMSAGWVRRKLRTWRRPWRSHGEPQVSWLFRSTGWKWMETYDTWKTQQHRPWAKSTHVILNNYERRCKVCQTFWTFSDCVYSLWLAIFNFLLSGHPHDPAGVSHCLDQSFMVINSLRCSSKATCMWPRSQTTYLHIHIILCIYIKWISMNDIAISLSIPTGIISQTMESEMSDMSRFKQLAVPITQSVSAIILYIIDKINHYKLATQQLVQSTWAVCEHSRGRVYEKVTALISFFSVWCMLLFLESLQTDYADVHFPICNLILTVVDFTLWSGLQYDKVHLA